MSGNRYEHHKSFDVIQAKHVGTGHSDTTKYEWATQHHRDSVASTVGHYDMLSYAAVAQNDAVQRVRHELLERMLQPCGPPPQREDEEEA
eukprot:CAMPEP_0198429496 /NCGR_PEP_ID=MMETSP1452-20131203/7797_1 /TAXON_ID=1181717 /ORGANISM="Synchroma pusillum, Strain CCMP3072" /LENGTH=89 /DNA_ID=CAMNT_0044149903 /DNA_START=36 /DNA_END=305 /DNA_ORIENTATION=+